MLGKRPYLLGTSSSRSLLIPDDAEGEAATFWKISQVTDLSPSPALSAPCKIVVGFEVGGEKRPPPEVCESPRSVLDHVALVPSQEKQQLVAKTSRSGLGNLLAAKSGSGDSEVVDQIHSEEVATRGGSFVEGSFKATFCSRETCSDEMCLSVKWSHCGSKDAVWFDKASNLDFMDADIFSGQRQACFEDEHLDADISPQRSPHHCQAMFAPCSQDMNVDLPDMNTALSQRGAVNACSRLGLKDDTLDARIRPKCGKASWQIGKVYAAPTFVASKENMEIQLSPRKIGMSHAPGSDDCKDACMTLQPTHVSQRTSLDIEECKGVSIQPSIFSAGSPPSCPHSLKKSSSGFLKMCAYCGHSLRLGKDVFMYRGDQAFCSAECRYQKIVTDEGKDK